ncbi:hypothetical protein APSETT444_004714 [Aspergillus pseudonomiae]
MSYSQHNPLRLKCNQLVAIKGSLNDMVSKIDSMIQPEGLPFDPPARRSPEDKLPRLNPFKACQVSNLSYIKSEISAALIDSLSEGLDQEEEDMADGEDRNPDKMPLEELISLWHSKGPPEPGFNVEESLEDMENEGQVLVDSSKVDGEDSNLPQLQSYRALIINSPSYKWLLTILHRECMLAPPEANVIHQIRDYILAVLPVSPIISRKTPTMTFEVFVRLNWNPIAFYTEQEYAESPKDAMERAITLTGSRTTAQALTCSQYMSQTWPLTGIQILQLITEFASGEHNNRPSAVLPDGTTVQVFAEALQCDSGTYPAVWVAICGTGDSIAEVGEQFAWLGCALRSSPVESGIACCRPFIKQLERGLFTDLPMWNASHIFEIDFSLHHDEQDVTNMTNGCCWYGLFRNPVIVEGYPIPRRPEPNTGLEIPLQILSGLTRTRRVNVFGGRTVLKGFSVMLVPTAYCEGIVFWHLQQSDVGERLSYHSSDEFPALDLYSSDLERARHLVGWCPAMKLYAGAPDAMYAVEESRLQRPSGKSTLAEVSMSTGHIITGDTAFSIGHKDIHVRRNCYVAKMRWISQMFLMLWDVQMKRGWLVNGASALLHLLRASLKQDKSNKFGSRLMLASEDIQDAIDPYQHDSALEVLLNPYNLKLKVYEEKDHFVYFEDRVEDFYDFLEKIIDYQARADYSQVPRSWLEGWDFTDLAKERPLFYPRRAIIDPEGRSWVDFSRSIHTAILLGRNFGDIIQPVGQPCPEWASLPVGRSYLAASVPDLENIVRACGDLYASPMRLTNDLLWYIPQTVFSKCQCLQLRNGNHSDLAQIILPERIARGLAMECSTYPGDSGGIVFGFNTNHRWYWKDKGDPSSVDLDASSNLAGSTEKDHASSIDSGLGRSTRSTLSIDSSSMTSSTFRQHANLSHEETSGSSRQPQAMQFRPKDYAVGIICALAIELKAVRASFDETHNECIPPADTHAYALGRIGKHNVVAACLPDGEYGTSSAADVASNMKRSFPAVTFCLLVGIGGGVPSRNHDIRLGDIVVSTPTGPYSGVLAYDLVKTFESGNFRLNGCLAPPPRHLRSAISGLKSDSSSFLLTLKGYLDKIGQSHPEYKHPGQDKDVLFHANYLHVDTGNNEMCESCDLSFQVQRSLRPSTHPHIHYGLIASGNQLIRSAQIRDQMSCEHDVLCFEMEGAGVMNTFPCLIIRGICDYADSHKDKTWQRYAAATAAAFAKLLLLQVRPTQEYEPAVLTSQVQEHASIAKRWPDDGLEQEKASQKKQRLLI